MSTEITLENTDSWNTITVKGFRHTAIDGRVELTTPSNNINLALFDPSEIKAHRRAAEIAESVARLQRLGVRVEIRPTVGGSDKLRVFAE